MSSWSQDSASCPSASAGLTLSSLHAFPFVAAVYLHHTFCLAVHLPPPHVVVPLPLLTPPLLRTCFGMASFGMSGLCFWQELAVAVPMDRAVSWQLVGRWDQVTSGTSETGQCGEDQRRRSGGPWVAGPMGVGRRAVWGMGQQPWPPVTPLTSVLSVWQSAQVLRDLGPGPSALLSQTAEVTGGPWAGPPPPPA